MGGALSGTQLHVSCSHSDARHPSMAIDVQLSICFRRTHLFPAVESTWHNYTHVIPYCNASTRARLFVPDTAVLAHRAVLAVA